MHRYLQKLQEHRGSLVYPLCMSTTTTATTTYLLYLNSSVKLRKL